ncbi:hypothetical protein GCM10022204_11120 [Microlunatus aurantiacus]|uniref:Uncharacterized protein n=1 Tax=Microlunatus aurantiacus TaxID=446786 RepID=A0ABP7CYP7_9ACTN
MTHPFPAGSEAAPGPYRCSSCGYPLDVVPGQPLRPCRSCHGRFWVRVGEQTIADLYDDSPGDGSWLRTTADFEER